MGCRIFAFCAMALVLLAAAPRGAAAQEIPPRAAPTVTIGVAALPAITPATLDTERAAAAYLAQVSPVERARARAYFEGGIVLRLFNVIYALVAAGLFLWLRISTWMRDFAIERTHSRFWQVPLYVALAMCAGLVLGLPLAAYESFARVHAYGFSSESFIAWLGDFGIKFAVALLLAMLVLTPIYAVMRRDRYTWWIWGAGIAIAFEILFTIAYPVLVAPLLERTVPLAPGALQQDIDSLARANGVPASDIYSFDESRRSTHMRAGETGLLGTSRIGLSDNLLEKASHDEVMAAAGSAIGRYALGLAMRQILLDALVILVGFGFLDWSFRLLADFFGGNWGVRRIDDPAGLPLLAALACVYLFVAMPVTNAIRRIGETQAELFSVNAVRKPDALATLALKQSAARTLDPSGWEEIFFYDRPSARTRIYAAMRWKAGHMGDPDIMSGPASPQ